MVNRGHKVKGGKKRRLGSSKQRKGISLEMDHQLAADKTASARMLSILPILPKAI